MKDVNAVLTDRFQELCEQTLYPHLHSSDRDCISSLNQKYRFTYQELRWLAEVARDLEMWQENSLPEVWDHLEDSASDKLEGLQRKKSLLSRLRSQVLSLKGRAKSYDGLRGAGVRQTALKIEVRNSGKKIFGDCPVASEKTVCCNLKTIDTVENCAFECSYCTVQTFYDNEVVFDSKLHEKLLAIELDPNRFYHFGTGQSSDSLVWGNKNGILDHLCDFAKRNPNILLEFKTKSDNVAYFMDHETPSNVVCSWSLNTEDIVNQEEHFTAQLANRLAAARKVADKGVKVAFHFHPIVYYENWLRDYTDLARKVQSLFRAEEVLFISFGSVTFIKPVIQAIRKRGQKTKILQMEMVKDPHGKLTYPDKIKFELFQAMHQAFTPWHEEVFMYLCMERSEIWDEVFGWHYETNELFESDFGRHAMAKLK